MALDTMKWALALSLALAGCPSGPGGKDVDSEPVDSEPVESDVDSPEESDSERLDTIVVESEPVDTVVVDSPVDSEPSDTVLVDTDPPDTLPVDTDPPDTVLVDTDPPDTLPVDTDPPDTLPVDTDPPDTLPVDTDPPDTLLVDTDPPDTLIVDTDPPDTLIVDTDPPDTPPVDTDPSAAPLLFGDLVITEIMQDANCASSSAEYFELYNASSRTLDLQGVVVAFPSRSLTHVLPGPLLMPPGTYRLIARDTNPSCYPTASAYFPGTWNLSPLGNTLEVYAPDGVTLLDAVNTVGFGTPRGASLQLDPGSLSPVTNNSPLAWCPTRNEPAFVIDPAASPADYGTPGRANAPCTVEDTAVDPSDTELDDVEFDPLDDAEAGDLVITEIMVQPRDCAPDSRGEYFEVLNTSDRTLDLRGLRIRDEDGLSTWTFRALIEPGAYAVAVNTREGTQSRCAPLTGLVRYAANTFNNNGDLLRLERPDGSLLDEVDFNGWPQVAGRAWQLRPTAGQDPTSNDDVASWCLAGPALSGGQTDRGTPGSASVCDADPLLGAAVTDLSPGDLVITELLLQSAEPGCAATEAQYLELKNTSALTVDLYGLRLSHRFGEVALTDHLAVPPGATVLGARFANPRCYPLPVDFWYPGLRFDADGDRIELLAGATSLDVVDLRTWPLPFGGDAWQLDPTGTAASNDDLDAWCPADQPIAGSTADHGTPGLPNPECAYTRALDTAALVGQPDGSDPTEPPDDTGAPTGAPLTAPELQPGDLVITELLQRSRDCFDARAEYLEVLNTTALPIDLAGVQLNAGAQSSTLGAALIGPGRRAVLTVATATPCYPLNPALSYAGVLFDNAGSLIRLTVGGTVIDAVDTSAWPALAGASWQLDPRSEDAGSNDLAAAWCPSLARINGTPSDRGTPGATNAACTTQPPTDSDAPVDTFDTFAEDTGAPALPITDARVGDLLITEIMSAPRDCADTTAEYFEITNPSPHRFNLDGLIIGAGSVRYTVDRPDGRLTIEPGEILVARRDSSTPCYSLPGAFPYSGVLLGPPNSDALFIANPTTVIDRVRFSALGVNEGRAASLSPERFTTLPRGGTADLPTATTFTGTYTNDDPSYWCESEYRLPGATSDKGSPGRLNATCLNDTDPVPHTGEYVAHVDELDGGELVLTELMIDPSDCSDLTGEWVEILNVSDLSIALDGLRLATLTDQVTVTTDLVLAPGELALGLRAASSTCYAGLTADFIYPSLGLVNAAGELRIENSHTVLDRVDYRAWVIPSGASLSLDEASESAIDNDDRANWCDGSTPFAGATLDRGTPGAPNGPCATPDTDEQPVTPLSAAQPGDLIVSEFLSDNTACPTAEQQYLEIYNTTDAPIDLNGLRVRTSSSFALINQGLVAQPGEPIVARSDSAGGCAQFQADVVLSGLTFAPTGNTFYLEFGAVRFDTVNTTGWSTPAGAAMQLIPGFESATDNDDEANWCPALQPLPGAPGVTGTPGELNSCDAPLDTDPPDTDDTDDTDLGPTPIAVREVYTTGNVTVAPGVFWTGQIHRRIGYVDLLTQTETLQCHWRWNTQATAVANVSASCPSCQFAFIVTRTSGSNQIAGGGSCGTAFSGIGGTPSNLGPITFAYSPTYGALLYSVGGSLQVYAYETTFAGTAFTWRKDVASYPYY